MVDNTTYLTNKIFKLTKLDKDLKKIKRNMLLEIEKNKLENINKSLNIKINKSFNKVILKNNLLT